MELYQKALLLSEKELNDYFLNHAVSLTESTIGFFHFVSDDQKSITLTAWNREALKNCVATYTTHYPIELAGNWVDSLRLKHPVIYNDFAKSPNQKGFPSGHVLIKRFMSIPIFEGGKVKIVFGVGNKTDPYNEDDVVQLQLIANELSKIYKQRQAENTLRESEKKYRSLFENMLDGFAFCRMIFDEQNNPVDFVCLEVNDAFERITGVKKEVVVGKRATEALPGIEKVNPELFEIGGRVALTCKEEKFETFFKLLNMWFSVSLYCPQKGYFAAIFENITERKKTEEALRQSEQKYHLLFTSITEGFALNKVIYDSDGKPYDYLVLDINPAAEKINNMKSEDVVGKTWRELWPGAEQYWFDHFNKAVLTGEPTRIQNYSAIYDKWFEVYVFSPSKDLVAEIFSDVTERKKAEETIERHAKHLEQLVDEKSKQLKDSERLAAIGATAGMVGHDIRNPLQAITSDVFLLKSELVPLAQGDQKNNIKESLDGIEKNIEYINKIVADLQDFARPLKPHAEEVDLKIVLEDLLTKNVLPENVKVIVKVEPEARKVVADCAYLNRIMNNLITNAVQAMPKGGKLTIQAVRDEKDVVITVKDSGVGVPEEVKTKLFTPMFTTKSKGQGFGLPVVKRMTEALGGTVTFESQEGKGTTFTVRLPPQRKKQ